jgi:hypothetical protein
LRHRGKGASTLPQHPAQQRGDRIFAERRLKHKRALGLLLDSAAESIGNFQAAQLTPRRGPAEPAERIMDHRSLGRPQCKLAQSSVRRREDQHLCRRVMHPYGMGQVVRDDLVGLDHEVPILQ